MKYPGYTFETVDRLPHSRILEIYASIQWLNDQEKKALNDTRRKGRR